MRELAERRMGEMLAATPRAKGVKGQLKGRKPSGSRVMLPPEKNVPTLAALGISKRARRGAEVGGNLLTGG